MPCNTQDIRRQDLNPVVLNGSVYHTLSQQGSGSRQRQRIIPLLSVSRAAQRPSQPHIQWGPEVKRGRSVPVTSYLYSAEVKNE
jgi:hypothetical protein